MKSFKQAILITALGLIAGLGADSVAVADDDHRPSISVMGGVHALNQNDTALPDDILNIPLVGTLTYPVSRNVAVEGEFTWLIPVEQDITLGSGATAKRKTPNILAYQANARVGWPAAETWTPYVVGGVGALTLLSNTDANALPVLDQSQTVFAINVGAGVLYRLTPRLALRGDFREFAAFPGNDTAGLSTGGNADPIWMERGTLGLALQF